MSNNINSIKQILEIVRTHDEKMPVQRLVTFLYVAERQTATRAHVAAAVGQSNFCAYRNLMALSDVDYKINRKTFRGIGWLHVQPDAAKPNRFIYEVSPKGKRIFELMRGTMT